MAILNFMTSNNNPSKRLFIGSLPYQFTEGELLSLFVKFGKITALRIVKTRWGKSRGMGYVEFETIEEAQAAKQKMDRYYMEERTIIVDFAQPDPFTTDEGKQKHYDSQEKRPLEKRKYLDEFGNRKFAVPRPRQEAPQQRGFAPSNARFEPRSFKDRDQRHNDDRPVRSFSYNNEAKQNQDQNRDSQPRRSFSYNNESRQGQEQSRNNQPKRNFSYNNDQRYSRSSQDGAFVSAGLPSPQQQQRRSSKLSGRPKFSSIGRSLNMDRSGEYVAKFMPDAPPQPTKKFKPKFGQKPEFKASDRYHVRGSVFKQRKFGSKVGAKFAYKSKKTIK